VKGVTNGVNRVLAAQWARAKVDELMLRDKQK